MSIQSTNLDMTILEEGDPADLTTVSDNFSIIDAVVGDVATVESSPTAAAHSTGEFLLYEGRLYKVTAAISAGASLVLGTNVAAANIGTELKSLQDSLSVNYTDISGTTNANGNIITSLSKNTRILGVLLVSDTWGVVIPWTHLMHAGWAFRIVDISGAVLANTTVTIRVYHN